MIAQDETVTETGVSRAPANETHQGASGVASPDDTASPTGHAPRTERQSIGYCPYCSEENLFPLEGGGWECRSCLRAFSVTFRGLVAPSRTREVTR